MGDNEPLFLTFFRDYLIFENVSIYMLCERAILFTFFLYWIFIVAASNEWWVVKFQISCVVAFKNCLTFFFRLGEHKRKLVRVNNAWFSLNGYRVIRWNFCIYLWRFIFYQSMYKSEETVVSNITKKIRRKVFVVQAC